MTSNQQSTAKYQLLQFQVAVKDPTHSWRFVVVVSVKTLPTSARLPMRWKHSV